MSPISVLGEVMWGSQESLEAEGCRVDGSDAITSAWPPSGSSSLSFLGGTICPFYCM